MRQLILIAHNLRSTHNVGSILRTAEGLGVTEVYLTGYTPYPETPNDERLPHLARKIQAQIQKTALGG
jgi:23S rRNA (guanosine2251-2'-O)-methyltransferase